MVKIKNNVFVYAEGGGSGAKFDPDKVVAASPWANRFLDELGKRKL